MEVSHLQPTSVHQACCNILTPAAVHRLRSPLLQARSGREHLPRAVPELARTKRECACHARVKRPRGKAPEPVLELEEGESLPEDLAGPDLSAEDPPGHRTGELVRSYL